MCVCATVHVFLPIHLCSGSPNLFSQQWAINKRRVVVWNMQKTVNGSWRIKSKFWVCLQFLRSFIRVDISLDQSQITTPHSFPNSKDVSWVNEQSVGIGQLGFYSFLIFVTSLSREKSHIEKKQKPSLTNMHHKFYLFKSHKFIWIHF